MALHDLKLGEFGGERLVKGGVCFYHGWWSGQVSAFGDWLAVVGAA